MSHVPSTLGVANVVSVAALDKPTLTGSVFSAPALWSGSNVGKRTVSLAAPGVQVRDCGLMIVYMKSYE